MELSGAGQVRPVCVLSGINEGETMIRSHWFFVACCIFALLVTGASAAVYASDTTFGVKIKYNNGVPTIQEEVVRAMTGKTLHGQYEEEEAPVNPEQEMINVITVTKDGKEKKHNIQTPVISNVYVSQTITDDTNVMQTTTEPGFPVLEIYWGYDKSDLEPWRYYMRVNTLTDGYAVYSDFQTKSVWTRPINSGLVQSIIAGGTIPEWGTV